MFYGRERIKRVPSCRNFIADIQFTLVVDDFGVKYVGEKHALHLKKTLEENYKVTTEWDGTR